jgi:tetratricopeptide (TPR) repeat protein
MAEANDLFIQILSRGPSQGTILVVLEKMKVEGRVKEVIQTCLRALNHYPDDIRLRRLLADSYLDAGLIGQAETELGKVVEHLDDWISVYKTQAGLFARQGRSEEALQALHRTATRGPVGEGSNGERGRTSPAERGG